MSSANSSETGKPTWVDRATSYLDRRGRLELWAGTLGMQQLQRAANEQSKNQEAESAHARRVAWGSSEQAAGEDVGDTILGDVTTTHVHHQSPPSQLGKLLLGAGLLATGVGVPIGAALVASGGKEVAEKVVERVVEKPVSSQDANTRYKLRLWRPE